MRFDSKTWRNLINVLFNDKKEVPIEYLTKFRKLAELQQLDSYCDFVRGNVLPNTLLEDPWEWKCLEDISKVLPDRIQILVLKGASARDMDLYPFNLLRKSADLDVFVSGTNTYKEQREFIEYLKSKNKVELTSDWEKYLRKLRNVSVIYEGNLVEVHFDLFSPLGNLCDVGIGLNKCNKTLEKEIIDKSFPYRGLKNIRKMNYEDYFLYSIFHFLKDFPNSSLRLILDAFLILEKKKTTLERLEKRSKETNQFFLFNIGKYIISQINNNQKLDFNLNWIHKKVFKIERILYTNKCSIKNRLIDSFSKASIAASGRLFLSFIYFVFYFFISNFILSDLDENPFSKQSMFNFINKVLYTVTKTKNLLKAFCLKLAGIKKSHNAVKILNTNNKKLVTIILQDLKLTLSVPVEFYFDLMRIWNGFVSENHKDEIISIERIEYDGNFEPNSKFVYSNNKFFLKMPNGSYGTCSLDGSGDFFACDFWDVRCFAMCLFWAMTLKREDLLLVHAGAININNECFIFPGESSTGKSTFFKLLTEAGIKGINDDIVLLKKENNIWYAYPTPYMSKRCVPIICEKGKLTRIIELIKVSGGYEISNLDKDKALALLFNNSIGSLVVDDSEFILSKALEKILDISKQINSCAQIKFSLEDTETFHQAFQAWMVKPEQNYTSKSKSTRLFEIRGRSMIPTFKPGDVLMVEEVLPDKIRPKDVVCFKDDLSELPVVHRVKYLIKHKDQITVITKGDNSIYEDSPNVFKSDQKILKVIEKLIK